MLLSSLLCGVEIFAVHDGADPEITAVVSDSRRAVPGCLFLCLPGTRTDGHRYMDDAISRGAAAVLIRHGMPVPDGIAWVSVENTRLAAAKIWNNRYGNPGAAMKIIAVTGTNGKTSVSWILRAILSHAGYKTGLIGTVRLFSGDTVIENEGGGEIADTPSAMTTPDPEFLYGALARMRDDGVEIVILEASSHALSLFKTDGLCVHMGLFTNLTPEHLDYHGTMEAYARAKARLFQSCPMGILNADDPFASRIAEMAPSCTFVRCSTDACRAVPADVRAVRVGLCGMDGVEYIYYSDRAVFFVRCPVPGKFTVQNTLLAVTAALRLSVDPVTVQEALLSFRGVEGRMERVNLPGAKFDVFIDYAHTPAALETLLRTVRAARAPGRKITLLFGCGGDRDPAKRPIMGRIATALSDFVIVTSDNCRTESREKILGEIVRGMDRLKPYTVIPDRREAIRYAVREAGAGDILLFAGKGHEKYEIDATGKHPFDEAALAAEYFSQIRKQRD